TGLTVGTLGSWVDKRLEMLKEVVPGITRVGILLDRPTGAQGQLGPVFTAAAMRLDLQLVQLEVVGSDDFEPALDSARTQHASGILLTDTPLLTANYSTIANVAAARSLPTINAFRAFAALGGLMSYGPDLSQLFRQAASYVDKILRGARPADLPVERPT